MRDDSHMGSSELCIRIVGLVDGTPTDFDGQYIVEYDPSRTGTHPVTGSEMPAFHLVTTPDIRRATRFGGAEAMDLYRAVDRRKPAHGDGVPNRPLTAFTIDLEPAPDLPPAGWYADPSGSRSWRWWNGTGWI